MTINTASLLKKLLLNPFVLDLFYLVAVLGFYFAKEKAVIVEFFEE